MIWRQYLTKHYKNKLIYGTPQEVIDEENDFNPKTDDERLGICIVSFFSLFLFFL